MGTRKAVTFSLILEHARIKELVFWASPRNGGDLDRFRRAVRIYEDFLARVRANPTQYLTKGRYDYAQRCVMHAERGVCVRCLNHQARPQKKTCQRCQEVTTNHLRHRRRRLRLVTAS